jgi:putative membrane protein
MKLSKLSIPYRAAQALLTVMAFGLFTGFDIAKFSLEAAAVIFGSSFTIFAGILFWFYLVWKNYEFEVTEDTFDIRSGVLNKKAREIPLKRIQNVDVRRNIVHRILGIAKVNLETAGGKSTEASLKYLDFKEAKSIQKRVRRLKQGLEEEAEGNEVETVFEISGKELTILSLTSISGKAVASGFGLLSVSGAFFSQIKSLLGVAGFIIAILSFLGVILISIIGSSVTNFSRYYDFKLFRRGDSLEYERGLVNRSEGSIPLEKIQTVSIEENPLKRLFGYATLKVETAGDGPGNQQNTGAEVAVPLAEKQRVLDLSEQVMEHGGFDIRDISEKAPRKYFGRYMIVSAALSGLAIGALALFELAFNTVFLLVLPPISMTAAYLKCRNKGFYEGEEFFYTMNGFWNRKTSMVPYYRIQNLDQVQTVFQERFGLKTIVLDTAGNSMLGGSPKVCDLDSEVSDNLFERVFESFRYSRN